MAKHEKYLKNLKYRFDKMLIGEMVKALSDLEIVFLGKGDDIINIRKGNSYVIRQGGNERIIHDREIMPFLQECRDKGYSWYVNLGRKLKC